VGVACIIRNDEGQVLFQRRTGAHGAGTWSVPGGHLEMGETFEQAVVREVREEIGIDVLKAKFSAVTNNLPGAWSNRSGVPNHYITIMMNAERWQGEPRICEPDKISELKWAHPLHESVRDEELFEPLRAYFAGEGYP
jgi:8-oxo-dGTP diphosphatase